MDEETINAWFEAEKLKLNERLEKDVAENKLNSRERHMKGIFALKLKYEKRFAKFLKAQSAREKRRQTLGRLASRIDKWVAPFREV